MDEHITFLLEKYGKNDQRTDEWHQKRGQMLTASEIYKACVDASPAAKHEIIISKLNPKSSGGCGARALIWGTRFEPIAKDIYCYMYPGLEIHDTTCIPHPDYSFLGASPDGILKHSDSTHELHGRLIEIKCPIGRVLDDSPTSVTYMCQMQLQMECTGLKKCEFVEMKFKELTYTEWVDSKAQYKSFYAVMADGAVSYKHFNDTRNIETWRKDVVNNDEDSRMLFWELTESRMKTVDHDPNWLLTNIESFKQVWDSVVQHRAAGTFPRNPKDVSTLIL